MLMEKSRLEYTKWEFRLYKMDSVKVFIYAVIKQMWFTEPFFPSIKYVAFSYSQTFKNIGRLISSY